MALDRDDLVALRTELAEDMRSRWNRDLPFGELLSDRWERGRRLGFGEGANIYESAYVMGDVRVGRGTWVGPFVVLDGLRAPVTIGEGCSISAGVQIYTHDAAKRTLSGGRADFEIGAVTIGDFSYIGSQAVILDGVTIGDHCVVGAQSLVNRDLEPYTIAFGAPARVRGRVEIDADGQVELLLDDPQ